MALLAIVLVAAVGAAAACSPAGTAVSPSATPVPLVSPVDGQVVKVDTEGLTRVRGFVLRTDDGQEVAFSIGVLENGAVFPPSHLAEHMATGSAVRVSFRDEDGSRVVFRIEDAPDP